MTADLQTAAHAPIARGTKEGPYNWGTVPLITAEIFSITSFYLLVFNDQAWSAIWHGTPHVWGWNVPQTQASSLMLRLTLISYINKKMYIWLGVSRKYLKYRVESVMGRIPALGWIRESSRLCSETHACFIEFDYVILRASY